MADVCTCKTGSCSYNDHGDLVWGYYWRTTDGAVHTFGPTTRANALSCEKGHVLGVEYGPTQRLTSPRRVFMPPGEKAPPEIGDPLF